MLTHFNRLCLHAAHDSLAELVRSVTPPSIPCCYFNSFMEGAKRLKLLCVLQHAVMMLSSPWLSLSSTAPDFCNKVPAGALLRACTTDTCLVP